ncbi:uncharacterized protein BBA_09010 [Beauveria bassiana ARSEF 2860]|uniref:Uncharacterized protein n=1 Tax=Beauveria bassiana (strain ARSEF 2860) TaxID=655819 RepID=J5JED3_BEAB2|nr:uncharacterized protein BBA_09010 [Beauveria bassiana ARSEF 2860]EJP62086.1 hypothetical protein BBA_09010 [Beauveria bassiana ARSEF 2860]
MSSSRHPCEVIEELVKSLYLSKKTIYITLKYLPYDYNLFLLTLLLLEKLVKAVDNIVFIVIFYKDIYFIEEYIKIAPRSLYSTTITSKRVERLVTTSLDYARGAKVSKGRYNYNLKGYINRQSKDSV